MRPRINIMRHFKASFDALPGTIVVRAGVFLAKNDLLYKGKDFADDTWCAGGVSLRLLRPPPFSQG